MVDCDEWEVTCVLDRNIISQTCSEGDDLRYPEVWLFSQLHQSTKNPVGGGSFFGIDRYSTATNLTTVCKVSIGDHYLAKATLLKPLDVLQLWPQRLSWSSPCVPGGIARWPKQKTGSNQRRTDPLWEGSTPAIARETAAPIPCPWRWTRRESPRCRPPPFSTPKRIGSTLWSWKNWKDCYFPALKY